MNLTTLISTSIETLKRAGIDNPQLDARLLVCHALGIDRAELLSQSQRDLTDVEQTTINNLITRRTAREPVARIIGKREFWGLEFGLNEATLEPRPDSETLVEAVLNLIKRTDGKTPLHPYRILDLGTGTGCLLLSLLHEIPNATGVGIDLNPRAMEQATQNATALGINNRATFMVSNWLDAIKEQPAPQKEWDSPPLVGRVREGDGAKKTAFDIIISNPPYIPNFYIQTLMPEVRDHDPILALDGGTDGLEPYRHLIPQLKNFLNPNGIVCFEVGVTQAPQVVDLFARAGFQNITTYKDLGGIERCVMALLT